MQTKRQWTKTQKPAMTNIWVTPSRKTVTLEEGALKDAVFHCKTNEKYMN